MATESEENIKKWEEARCPICLDHPHNAILLLCSSYQNGCRPYICNTSRRHSNCFTQFKKSKEISLSRQTRSTLSCPLCRGEVSGWSVEEPARLFMNQKPRTCVNETCNFSGTYLDLKNHARSSAHPVVRPSEAVRNASPPEAVRNARQRMQVFRGHSDRPRERNRQIEAELAQINGPAANAGPEDVFMNRLYHMLLRNRLRRR